eukprot:TRINITY_DN19686_c0_g1_i1.p2 TRINITY_DN19686_c0_g1~~TRINITY_DN19686_c0_g1_i1.p2  ORF type:complete len:163 (-),score=48.35 TRINITY_DN19686_c0_g1_i1:697-1185(-)
MQEQATTVAERLKTMLVGSSGKSSSSSDLDSRNEAKSYSFLARIGRALTKRDKSTSSGSDTDSNSSASSRTGDARKKKKKEKKKKDNKMKALVEGLFSAKDKKKESKKKKKKATKDEKPEGKKKRKKKDDDDSSGTAQPKRKARKLARCPTDDPWAEIKKAL